MIDTLRSYFNQRNEVAFSFLYGSQSTGKATRLSDVDVAVYFYPTTRHPIECEEEIFYPTENEIWGDLERITGKPVELLVLNRAPATVAASALRGIPIGINDWGLYLDYFEVITHIAEDFSELVIETYERASAEREIKLRLIKHITFLESELQDFGVFKALSREDYQQQRSKRRDVERWIENIINASIDISKILLLSENIPIPETYKELVTSVGLIGGFDKEQVQTLSESVRFRNIIAHEYIDIRWRSIRKFIEEAEPAYRGFLENTKRYLDTRS